MINFIISILLLLLLSTNVNSFEMLTGRGAGMGGAGLLSNSNATMLVNIPTAGISEGQWNFESGFSRRFELSDLDLIFFAGATRFNKISVAIGAWQFGNPDLYAEQVIKGNLSYRLDSLTVGFTLSAMQVQFGGDFGTLRSPSFGLGLSYRFSRYLVSFSADDLTKPNLAPGLVRNEPSYQLNTEFIGGKSYSITGRVKLINGQSPNLSIGQLISLSQNGSFFWGFSTKPFEFGGGLDIKVGSTIFTYATRVHPVLGLTHTASISYKLKKKKASGDGLNDFK